MRPPRELISDDDDLLVVAVQEVAAAVGPIVAELAAARARFVVAEEIERRDLVVRQSQEGQPSASELLGGVLEALERHALGATSTATGAHDLARRVGVQMGVHGAHRPALRRTRAEVDDDPNPRRRREGTRGLVGGVLRGDVKR